MPVQPFVIMFVLIALGAIVWRFLPRSPDGAVRLPTLIDESVGMYVLRRVLRRPTEPTGQSDVAIRQPADEPPDRIGVAWMPPSTPPTRFVVSQAPSGSLTRLPEPAVGSPRGVPGARPSGALATQRRWAGSVALVVVGVALVTVVLGSRQLNGGVLAATGTPAGEDRGPVQGSGATAGPVSAKPSGSASQTIP